MRHDWIYRRGDVYLADCGEWHGSIQGGIRPVVIMQNNIGNRHSPTVCVVKLTTRTQKKPDQPTHYVLKNIRGIPYPSQVLAEQPDTINKTDIIRYMAHLPRKHMEAIGKCVEIEMGLRELGETSKNPKGTADPPATAEEHPAAAPEDADSDSDADEADGKVNETSDDVTGDTGIRNTK